MKKKKKKTEKKKERSKQRNSIFQTILRMKQANGMKHLHQSNHTETIQIEDDGMLIDHLPPQAVIDLSSRHLIHNAS